MNTYIIAEIAWSPMGDLNRAIKIMKGAKKAGANSVGIHIVDMESFMTRNYNCLDGQTLSNSADRKMSIYDYLEKINMRNEDWLEFDKKAKEINIDILAKCGDLKSFEFSKKMHIAKYAIAAQSFVEFDLIREIVRYHDDIVLRIGGATLDEIDKVIDFILKESSKTRLNLLVGIQLYPTPIEHLHIKSINTLRERYKDVPNVSLGIADHIAGNNRYTKYLPALALPYGIESIEKHITTKYEDNLEDYEAALGIDDFIEFVDFIRNAEIALGDGSINYLTNFDYKKYRLVHRKRIVAARYLKKGTILDKDMVNFKRSDYGTQLNYIEKILGKKLNRDIEYDEGITLKDLI